MKTLALIALVFFAPLAAADAASSERNLDYIWTELKESMHECGAYMAEAAESGGGKMRAPERNLCISLPEQSRSFATAARKHAARHPSADATTILRSAIETEKRIERMDFRGLK